MQRRDFLGALGVGAFAAAPHLTIDPGLDPAAVVARVRATGARSVRIGSAFNDYAPAVYKAAWQRIAQKLRSEGLGQVRMEWAFRPTGELVPFMDWHPGGAGPIEWRLAGPAGDPSSRSFLAEAGIPRA
ncbi:MAG: hypothetical protein HXY18_18395 [Bryobacteraceae bacterium]|nr:hypothetical protein [Bryobacteraceae bacterium]